VNVIDAAVIQGEMFQHCAALLEVLKEAGCQSNSGKFQAVQVAR
jgi:hypothetical protein